MSSRLPRLKTLCCLLITTLITTTCLAEDPALKLNTCLMLNTPTMLGRTVNVAVVFDKCVDHFKDPVTGQETKPSGMPVILWQIPITRLKGLLCAPHPQEVYVGGGNCNVNATFKLQYSLSDQTQTWESLRLRLNILSGDNTHNAALLKNPLTGNFDPGVNLCKTKDCPCHRSDTNPEDCVQVPNYDPNESLYMIDDSYRVIPH